MSVNLYIISSNQRFCDGHHGCPYFLLPTRSALNIHSNRTQATHVQMLTAHDRCRPVRSDLLGITSFGGVLSWPLTSPGSGGTHEPTRVLRCSWSADSWYTSDSVMWLLLPHATVTCGGGEWEVMGGRPWSTSHEEVCLSVASKVQSEWHHLLRWNELFDKWGFGEALTRGLSSDRVTTRTLERN